MSLKYEKVTFELEIRPNQPDICKINRKILYHLVALGFKIQKNILVDKSYNCIIHELHGEFPGGQTQLDDELNKLKSQIGPFQFDIDLRSIAHLFKNTIQQELENVGFTIIKENNCIYTIEYPGSQDEAICTLNDLLYELEGK